MNRYKTRWYVTTDEDEALRLARVDGTPAEEIEVAENVHPVHVESEYADWALWSDGVFTTAIGLPKSMKSVQLLSPDAASIITNSRGSDTPATRDTLLFVSKIDRIVRQVPWGKAPSRAPYASLEVDEVVARMKSGERKKFYIISMGYPEGYYYEICFSMDEVTEALESLGAEVV